MPKILVCQHVAFEILGTFDALLKQSKFRIKYVNFEREPFYKPNIEGYDGLIVLGGPMHAHDTKNYPNLDTEVNLIRSAIKKNIPVLGICLGAQLIARALNKKVHKLPKPEIGWSDVSPTIDALNDPVLRHLANNNKIFQWHEDYFELPDDTVLLASSNQCTNQAFRYNNNVYGFQFHLEVDELLIHRWLRHMPHKVDTEEINLGTHNYIEQSKKLSNKVFGSFIDLFDQANKFHTLSSR